MPEMTEEFIQSVSNRYIELFEKVTGTPFVKAKTSSLHERIEENVAEYLANG